MQAYPFRKRLLVRRLLIVALAAFSLFAVVLGVAFLYFHFNKEAIKQGLLHYAQERQEGEIIIGDINFSPLSYLPDLAIRLDSVVYYEHLSDERAGDEIPILNIHRVYLAFDLFQLLFGRYDVSEITLRSGDVHIFFYEDNAMNLFNALGINQVKGQTIGVERSPPPDIDLNLAKVTLDDLEGHFIHQGLSMELEVVIEQLSAALRYKDGVDDVGLAADLEFRYVQLGEKAYLRNKDIRLYLDFLFDENTLESRINRSKLIFEGLAFDMAGTYSLNDSGWADLTLDASDEDLTLLSYLIEDEFLDRNLDLLRQGNLYLSGTIKGKTINHLPEMEFNFGAEHINLEIPGQEEGIEDLGFSAWFSTGEADDFSEAELRIKELKGNLPGGQIGGGLEIVNFADPVLTASCELRADIRGWDQVFRLGDLDSLAGRVAFTANIRNQRMSDSRELLEGLDSIRLDLSEVALRLPGLPRRLERISGSFVDRNNRTKVQDLRLHYGNSDLLLQGALYNTFYYLIDRSSRFRAELIFDSRQIRLNELPVLDTLDVPLASDIVKGLHFGLSYQVAGEQLALGVKDFRAEALGGRLQGDFDLRGLEEPLLSLRCDLSGVEVQGLDRLASGSLPDSLSGTVFLSADIEDWKFRSAVLPGRIDRLKLDMHDFSFHLPGFPYRFREIEGDLTARGDQFVAEALAMRYGSSRLVLSGKLTNALARISGAEAPVKADLEFSADELPWREWPYFDTLSKGIARECVRDLDLALSLRSMGNKLKKHPWRRQWAVNVRRLKGDFELLPDIGDLRGAMTFDLADSGAVHMAIDRMETRLPLGLIGLRGGAVRLGESGLFAETELTVRDLRFKELPILLRSGEVTPSADEGQRIDLRFPLRGRYHFPSRTIRDFAVAGGALSLLERGASRLRLEAIDVRIREAGFNREENEAGFLSSLDGEISVGKLQGKKLEGLSVRCQVKGRQDYYYLRGSMYQFSEVREEGLLEIDLSGGKPVIELEYRLEDFPVEVLTGKFYPERLITGPVDIALDLSTAGENAEACILNADGSLVIKGRELTIHGVDLDELLKRYRRTQRFDLIDVGAVFLAGPFGAVVTKGMDFARVFDVAMASGKQSRIPRLHSAWAFHDGLVESRDVALTTKTSRIAVDGRINMRTDSIDQLTIAVVDEKGCSVVDQTRAGSSDKLEVSELRIAGALLGPVINILDLVSLQQCEPVYEGVVDHP